MDVFSLQQHVVNTYKKYVTSFYQFKDDRIKDYVESELQRGKLWPEPLIQLNPSFESGGSIDDLVNSGLLHPKCSNIFRRRVHPDDQGDILNLYRHQREAIQKAHQGHNYVLTTGTGSGKSLSYIIPIVDHVLRTGSGKGIQAVIVYPMNALANSQMGELVKFLGKENPSVTFNRYTGQESNEEKQAVLDNPPDILLTNFVMLELIFSRHNDRKLVEKMKDQLRFIVLDELHTYRGRQGADVAMLVRRVQCTLDNQHIQMVGTSATMGGGRTWTEKQKRVSQVASTLFGQPVYPDAVIGETLVRNSPDYDFSNPDMHSKLCDCVAAQKALPDDYAHFIQEPLVAWIENTLGIRREAESDRWIRSTPRSILSIKGSEGTVLEKGCAQLLSEVTGCELALCAKAIKSALLKGNHVLNPSTDKPVFIYRLHQFFSRGETVYASLEDPAQRQLTMSKQRYASADRSKVLLPLGFCRNCGQEYYLVRRVIDEDAVRYESRELNEMGKDTGYLYHAPDDIWPGNDTPEYVERIPQELRTRAMEKYWPNHVRVSSDGVESADGYECSFFSSPFKFCLRCGISYPPSTKKEYQQLTQLASDGRSTATTILSLSSVQWLRNQSEQERISPKAKKILTFTDNRQDASLQAGHFNDFVYIGLVRAALYKALTLSGPEGMRYEELANRVFAGLDLQPQEYALDGLNYNIPNVRINIQRALKTVLVYSVLADVRRGWRINMPNLEQCGLLEISYDGLEEYCGMDDLWEGTHSLLRGSSAKARFYLCRTLLDYLRKDLCIECDELSGDRHGGMRASSRTYLREPWAIDDTDVLDEAKWAWTRSKQEYDKRDSRFITEGSAFGKFLGRNNQDEEWLPCSENEKLSSDDKKVIIKNLFDKLVEGALLKCQDNDRDGLSYRIPVTAIVWRALDGTKRRTDPMVNPTAGEYESAPNPFFLDFYRSEALRTRQIRAKEHTAQVDQADRQDREKQFSDAQLPVLYCSPTMELGVDISDLNVVGMRNVPPTPANYAQRSGRAGRSGQPALVLTYCSTGSAHDQYFFRRKEQMVAGEVATPRLELANEDLILSHLHSIWLYESQVRLESSMGSIMNLEPESPSFLKLTPKYQDLYTETYYRAKAIRRALSFIGRLRQDIGEKYFTKDDWASSVINGTPEAFDRACERWRGMYSAAIKQMKLQNGILMDMTRTKDHEQAQSLHSQAVDTLALLTSSDNNEQTDFYPYRYFASEGFLPGYNFPRLPITAYIGQSARGARKSLSRPRFLAISEFGPHSIIYHEGSHYKVDRVLLPVEGEDRRIPTKNVRICGECGYLMTEETADACEMCGEPLIDSAVRLNNLFRMETVVTRRNQRITSEEEDRQRKGYDLVTAVRFAQRESRNSSAEVMVDDTSFASMEFGATATVWRINIGLRNRKNPNETGFFIDVENGRWIRSTQQKEEEEPDRDDELAANRTQRVIPFVEDRRNCLLFKPSAHMSAEAIASLQAALKMGIQAEFQLEDSELAAEPLPNANDRKILLFYEAAEGGAGILRQLVEEPGALSRVALKALDICHFTENGEDMYHAPQAEETCLSACYDCLMSYTNQLDHKMLDRHLIRDILLNLTKAEIRFSPTDASREEHFHALREQCESELEKRWLQWVMQMGFRLPKSAQTYLNEANLRPDFLYETGGLLCAVFIDGPIHDQLNSVINDPQTDAALERLGILSLRFRYDEGEAVWLSLVNRFKSVFGVKTGEETRDEL